MAVFGLSSCVAPLVLGLLGASSAFIFSQKHTVVQAKGAPSDACLAKRLTNDCHFFTCFEERLTCGRSGYALGYANKYCHRFQDNLDRFNAQGQSFIANMTRCQMENMVPVYQQTSRLDCQAFYNEAFSKLGDCYVKSGFCDIIEDNFDGFFKTFDSADFLNFKLVNQVFAAAKHCKVDLTQTIIKEFTSASG